MTFWNEYLGGTVLTTQFILLAALAEFVVHYVTDLTKVKVCDNLGWVKMGKDSDGKPCLNIYSNLYFKAIGFDQTIHALTYIVIVSYI